MPHTVNTSIATDPSKPRRIAIIGTSGAGKTTLGRELGRRLGVPFVECDSLAHKPNWVPASADELRAGLDAALAGHDRWVIDGMLERQLGDFISARIDLIVWLDLPLALSLLRTTRRSLRRLIRRETLWNGNVEPWHGLFWGWDSLLVYAVRKHVRDRRAWPTRPQREKILRLRSPAAVSAWLDELAPTY
jgi:adenylate kinase family enzyme